MAQSAKSGEMVEKPLLEYSTTYCTGKKLWGLHFPELSGWSLTLGLEIGEDRKHGFSGSNFYLKLEQESNLHVPHKINHYQFTFPPRSHCSYPEGRQNQVLQGELVNRKQTITEQAALLSNALSIHSCYWSPQRNLVISK